MHARLRSDDEDGEGGGDEGEQGPWGWPRPGFAHQLLPETRHPSPSAAIHLDRLPDVHSAAHTHSRTYRCKMPTVSFSLLHTLLLAYLPFMSYTRRRCVDRPLFWQSIIPKTPTVHNMSPWTEGKAHLSQQLENKAAAQKTHTLPGALSP